MATKNATFRRIRRVLSSKLYISSARPGDAIQCLRCGIIKQHIKVTRGGLQCSFCGNRQAGEFCCQDNDWWTINYQVSPRPRVLVENLRSVARDMSHAGAELFNYLLCQDLYDAVRVAGRVCQDVDPDHMTLHGIPVDLVDSVSRLACSSGGVHVQCRFLILPSSTDLEIP